MLPGQVSLLNPTILCGVGSPSGRPGSAEVVTGYLEDSPKLVPELLLLEHMKSNCDFRDSGAVNSETLKTPSQQAVYIHMNITPGVPGWIVRLRRLLPLRAIQQKDKEISSSTDESYHRDFCS